VTQGNDLNNILAGSVGDNAISGCDVFDLLVGAEGRDMLTGGGDSDSFSFAKKSGVDTITDFSLGEDDIQIKYIAGISDFGHVQNRMSSVDFDKDGDLDTVINLGDGDRIRLTDIAKDDLQMSDFNIFT
jgi:serralysin